MRRHLATSENGVNSQMNFKTLKRAFSAVAAGVFAFALNAYANDFSYDSNANILTVSLSDSSLRGRFANVSIIPSDFQRQNLSAENISEGKMIFDIIELSGNSFDAVYKLENALVAGEYAVYIDLEDSTRAFLFIKCDREKLDETVRMINGGGVLEHINGFGADTEIFERNSDKISRFIKNSKSAYFTNSSFAEAYIAAEGVSRLMNREITADEFCELYSYTCDEIAERLKEYGKDKKEKFEKIISGENVLNNTPEEILSDAMSLTEVICGTASDAEKVMLEYIEQEKLSDGNYAKLNSYYSKNVMTKLINRAGKCSSMKELYDAFITETDNQYKEQKSFNEKSPARSGGGSGGGGRKIEIPVSENIADNGNNEGQAVFSDINSHWAKEYIEKLYAKGIIAGYKDKTFRPDNSITRAEMAVIISRMLGLESDKTEIFSDVFPDSWYSGYIGAVSKVGIIQGDGKKYFPEEYISRQDTAVMLYRMLQYKGISFEKGGAFIDEGGISPYAHDSVYSLSGGGIVTGYEGKFRPGDPISRAEATAIIERALKY